LEKGFIINLKEIIIKTRLAFFAALAVFLAIAVTPVSAAKPFKIIKGPYLQQVTPDSIVIMWETNTAADSRVDYDGQLVEDSTQVKIHEVLLDGLDDNTTYSYTVTSGGTTSAESTFATAPAGPRNFRFVAYGDTRTNANAHAAVIQAIIASGPELVIHTGDLVESGDDYGQWGRQFFDPAYDLMIKTPLLPIIGNHEGSGNLFRDFFSLGNNDYWFAFTYGGVRFIGLNTHNASYSPGSTQYNWLLEELTSDAYTNATWHIVYFHHPPYSSGSHGDTQGVKDHLVPLFEQYGVDMVFSGHDHHYERSFKDDVHYIVTGGGGAPLRDINVKPNPYQIYAESTFHHCVIDVDVDNSELIFEARYNDGTVLDGPITLVQDSTPPTPDPMEWAQTPESTGSTSISMTAATASDDNGVEYYFDEISGNPGGSDSGWQDSSTYTDTGLLPNTTYTYTVKARDKSSNAELNVTAPSSPASAKTYQIGDFDHSRIIDWTDLRMFVDYWLDSCSSPSWCDERDINRSGRVSLPDFAEFARHWLEDNNP